MLRVLNVMRSVDELTILFAEEFPQDDALWPEVGVFDNLNILFLDAKFEATESIVTSRNFFNLHNLDALTFNSHLRVFRRRIHAGVTDVECHGKVCAST